MEPLKRLEHMDMAKKLQDDILRLQYINKEIQEEKAFKYLSCTNRKVGPPNTLNLKEKEIWEANLADSLSNCVMNILVPAVKRNISENKEKLTSWINDKPTLLKEGSIKKQIETGVGRAQRKWRKRNILSNFDLPASLDQCEGLDAGEVGILRRGEQKDKGNGILCRYNRINNSKDLYKILAHSIYGSGKYRNFISRSIFKYMNAYSELEADTFIPHIANLKNGSTKWINNWHTFYALLSNRDLCFSSYELVLISKLYDINIKVFIEDTQCVLKCIWQTKRRSGRIINLLFSVSDEWALLQYRRIENSSSVSEKAQVVKESKNTGEIDVCKNKIGEVDIDNFVEILKDDSVTDVRSSILDSPGVVGVGIESLDRVDNNQQKYKVISDRGLNIDWVDIGKKQEDVLSVISDSTASRVIIDTASNVTSHSCIEIDRIFDTELDWSVITSDSENKKELLEIERKINNHFKTDSDIHINSRGQEDAWSVISDSLDSCSMIDGWSKDTGYPSMEIGRKVDKELDWSVITSDSESKKELLEIESKINKQFITNTMISNKDVNSHFWEDSENLYYSQISSSTISSNKEDINNTIGKDYNIERNLSKNYILDSGQITNLAEYHNSILTSINNSDKSSEVTDIKEAKSTLDKKEKKYTLNIDCDSDNSSNSIDEEFSWLFEENSTEIEFRNRLSYSSDKGEDIASSKTSSDSKVSSVELESKIRRRKFWMKWKNKIRNKNRNITRRQEKQLLKEGIQQKSIDVVFDYYSKGLDRTEIELLSKGSTFCIATSKIEEDRFRADIYAYGRRLRLHEEYNDQGFSQFFSQLLKEQRDSQESTNSSLTRYSDIVVETQVSNEKNKIKVRKLPSTYDPDSKNRNLARYCNCIQEESLLAIKAETQFRDNISIEHRKALNSLKKKVEEKDIVITLADKGSGIVVVDYDTYINKGTKYIEVEAKAYSKTEKTHRQIVTDIVSQRDKIVKKLREHKVIEVETATYCMKQLEEKVTGMKFYYKIHKDTCIDTMPLRPLQSCIGSPTHHLSQVLTDLLQPYLSTKYIPTFIQDSNQLLYRLSKIDSLDSNSTLVSSDVAALYPSIPHEAGLDSIKQFLIKWSDYNSIQIKYIMLALELVITQNYVMWNGVLYSQDSGVAMGTPVAVAYANIFMDWIDRQLRQEASYMIEHIRYIDDNLFIIPEDKITELMQVANSLLVPYIKFTYEKLDKNSEVGLPFLDTQLFISKELKIESRLYTKKTDRHTYLLPTSFHPSHITRNIPLAVFNRIRRICSKFEWFQADAMLAIQWLEDRGYKYTDIKKAVEKSSIRDRWEMIENIEYNRIRKNSTIRRETETSYEIPIIITYSQNAKKLKEVFKNRQELLDASFNQTRVRPRLAFRRQRNIGDILIQKGLRNPILGSQVEEKVLASCGIRHRYRTQCPCKGRHDQQSCRCCMHLKTQLDNVEVKLYKKVDCESKNLVYVLGCNICHKLYVGETQQKLKDRFLQHLNNINKLSQPLYIHFKQVHRAEHIFISVLEAVRSNDHTIRKIREAWWINKLQSLEPRGFNIKLECNQIYQASSTTINIERERSSRRL